MYGVIDGLLQRAELATISVLDQGFLRGDGAFEVLLVYGGRPFAADLHLDRLERSCAALRLPCPRGLIERDLTSLVATSSKATYAVRIVLTRAGRRIVLAEAWSPPPKPSRLWVVPNHQQPLLAGVKSLSYAANMLSRRLAREQGYDDALWVSADGCVLEAQTAAFFWVSSRGELCTPPLSEPILDSITRRLVMEQVNVLERRCPRPEMLDCREAFLTGTTKEIQPVASIDARQLSEVPGPATKRAIEAYRRLIVAEARRGTTELALRD
jgi:branched-chain amino acid aminotransferase